MKKITWSTSYTSLRLEELSASDQLLVQKALESREHAYAPYSFYKVGAAAELDNGQVVLGNNQENAAYPSGLCAERVALFACGAMHPNSTILTLAIATASKGEIPAASCGSCRQVMMEFELKQKESIRVLLADDGGNVLIVNSVKDLMPLSFDPDRLG